MHFFLELFLCAHVTKSVNFINELWYRKGCYVHYEKEVILEDIVPPPRECMGTLQCPCHRVPSPLCSLGCTCQHLAQNIGVGSYMPVLGSRPRCWSYTLALSSKHRCWVVYAGSFVYAHIPRQQQGEGRGSRWGGLSTFVEVILAGVLVDLAFRVVFAVFGIRSHSCSCLLAVDG
jgi:hypothetical protein